jgi:uncharacterized protein
VVRPQGGTRKPPPRAERLMDEYRAAVAAMPAGATLLIGGKSMGGRVASLIADELFAGQRIAGLVCLGYPFHPPKKPEQLRTAHLEHLACPALMVQGERDPFGGRNEVEAYRLSPAIRFHWVGDGDHDLGPRGASGFTRKGNLTAAADAIAAFAATGRGPNLSPRRPVNASLFHVKHFTPAPTRPAKRSAGQTYPREGR